MTGPRLCPLRVVVCDDNEELRELVRFSLDREPAVRVVAEAGDGPSAVHTTARTQPDVVVLDLTMPGLPSDELVVAVRSAAPAARVVVFSGNARSRALGLSNVTYVEKSAPYETLVRAVTGVLARTA